MLPVFHFIPSHREKFFGRLNELANIPVIFDLEDGVPEELRKHARAVLRSHKEQVERTDSFVRINKESGVYDPADIQLIKEIDFKGVVIPKVESAREIQKFLSFFEKKDHQLKIICLIESFRGLEELREICTGYRQHLYAIGLGLEDFLSEVAVAEVQPDVIEFIKLRLVSTCRAYGLYCLDTVSLNFNDKLDVFREECQDSRALLFDGRFSIHPTQIPVIKEIYPPTVDEVEWARNLIEKVKGQENIGYQKVGGEVLSGPKVKKAQLILNKAGISDV
jgi:citrate lyase beta subunit